MERTPEPELMEDLEQVRAYAEADFDEPHARFVELFRSAFPDLAAVGTVVDLGCGPADVTVRFARAFPQFCVHGLDGSPAMLARGRERLTAEGLESRIQLHRARLPQDAAPRTGYDVVISNSLLHHLGDPMVLWRAIRALARPAAPVFVMDLRRPASRPDAEALVARHAGAEPAVLRRDFLNSLLAAYRPAEVEAQIRAAGLDGLVVEVVSDRHLIAVGRAPG